MIEEFAYAKINLSLDIGSRRTDGYHELEMVMQSVSLCDRVELEKADSIRLICEDPGIPLGPSNTVWKAAELFCQRTGASGVKIHLKKQIPSEAGLGGGSADAAAVLRGMNRLFSAGLSKQELRELGLLVGADVPFCVTNGLCLAKGVGEILSPLGRLPACKIVIVKPEVGVSTKEAFRLADSRGDMGERYTEHVLAAVEKKELSSLGRALGNDFRRIIQLPEIEAVIAKMLRSGACGAEMTGSGSAVFGIFSSEKQAFACAASLQKEYRQVFLCEPWYPEGSFT